MVSGWHTEINFILNYSLNMFESFIGADTITGIFNGIIYLEQPYARYIYTKCMAGHIYMGNAWQFQHQRDEACVG